MHWLDWTIIAIYFAFIAGITLWAGRQNKSTEDYFLAGRHAGFFLIGASIFSSNIGSEHIVGLAGSGASSGLAMAHWELHAWVLVILAYVFVPFYYKSGVYTMPEYLERRFGPTSRWILSIVSLTAYVLTKVSVTIYAGALVFESLLPTTFGTPENAFWVGAFSTVILTGIYTVIGGMRAVIYTEAPQAVLLIIGSCIITFIGLHQLGGWHELVSMAADRKEDLALWRPLDDPQLPWLAVLIASPIIGIWYWCTDQYIVQRTLTGKNLKEARRGALFGGLLKVTPVLIFLIPGLIGWALHQKGIIHIETVMGPNGTEEIVGDKIFPTMVEELLPIGLRGLIIACMLAALMSSLASLFNSCATLFTVDIYEKLKPNQSQRHYVLVGRIATTVVVGLGILWIPIMRAISDGGLYDYLQGVQGYLAPPIAAVFLLGLFWKRINAYGAAWCLGGGFALGMTKLAIESVFGATRVSDPAFLAAIGDFNKFYAAGVLFVISILILIGVSLMTEAPPATKTDSLTYATVSGDPEVKASWDRGNTLLATLVLVLVLGMYLYFTFWLSF
ncbi:MAG: solute:Na+ symporter SSS family [Puniceicoccaceae bacterium 5H]|nr:MAG: solute:Na+ symporter SSS family [Puniceicoccaceae bacterium 5H]